MDHPPEVPDTAQVLKHNHTLLRRHVATRLTLAVARSAGWDAALPAFCAPAALLVLIYLVLRLRHGARLKVCEKVLRTYPLEYRTRVTKKGTEWKYLGDGHNGGRASRGSWCSLCGPGPTTPAPTTPNVC